MTKTYPMSDPKEACARIVAAGGPKIDPAQTRGVISALNNGMIAIMLTHKPMFVPQSLIEEKMDAFFGGAQ